MDSLTSWLLSSDHNASATNPVTMLASLQGLGISPESTEWLTQPC